MPKTIFLSYHDYFKYGKDLEQADPKMSYTIRFYAIDQLKKQYQSNKNIFNEQEKQSFMSEIKSLNTMGKETPNANEYKDFLENMFANVDQEDREGEVSVSTAAKFKMMSVLINVLKTWEEKLEDDWSEKRRILFRCYFIDFFINFTFLN